MNNMSDFTDFLKTRRSVVAKNMTPPGPSAAQIADLLEIGARVPDHGKLAPWRFLLFADDARAQFDAQLQSIFKQQNPQAQSAQVKQACTCFTRAPFVIGVISSPRPHPKIPTWEQTLSAAAVCQNILIAAQSMGFAAQWLTEWIAYDEAVGALLGLGADERVAGFIYIGTASAPPKERTRPDVKALTRDWQAS